MIGLAELHYAPDVLIGGPPCQGFSRATPRARKRPDDPRNMLIAMFGQFVEWMQPRTFLMENVPDLKFSPEYRQLYDRLCRTYILTDAHAHLRRLRRSDDPQALLPGRTAVRWDRAVLVAEPRPTLWTPTCSIGTTRG